MWHVEAFDGERWFLATGGFSTKWLAEQAAEPVKIQWPRVRLSWYRAEED